MELKNSYLHCSSLQRLVVLNDSIDSFQTVKPHHLPSLLQKKQATEIFQSLANRKVDQRILNQRFGFNN